MTRVDDVPERRWLPALTTLGVMLAVPIIGVVASGTTGGTGPERVTVGSGVEIQLPADWTFAERLGDDRVSLSRGNLSLVVYVDRSARSPGDALDAYVAEMGAHSQQLAVTNPEAVEIGGSAGLRVAYVASTDGVAGPIEGEVTSVEREPGVIVVYDGWATEGSYGALGGQVDTIILSTRVDS